MLNSNKIAVIIPCYKVKKSIFQVLESIPSFIDVIYVIDDKCPELSGEFVRKLNLPNVKVIFNTGANVAIWNIKNYKILKRNNKIYIDDFPLIFYHFANLKQLNKNSFSTSLSRVFVSCEGLLKNEVYLPYLKEFLNHQNQDSISISKKDLHSKGFITFIRNCSRKVRLFFYNDIIKID